MCGFIAHLVEHRTGIAEVTGSNPVEALIFFRLLLSNGLNWKIYCDDHSSLSNWNSLSIAYDKANTYELLLKSLGLVSLKERRLFDMLILVYTSFQVATLAYI